LRQKSRRQKFLEISLARYAPCRKIMRSHGTGNGAKPMATPD
jgi:hypothetical protein